jgi:mRNA interferase RelE/StbE
LESKVWSIELKPSASRALAKFPETVKRRLGEAISKLAEEPRPPGVKKLAGQNSLYRVRVDDYRIIYQIEDQVLTILVVRIGDRKEVYRNLKRL